MAGMFTKAIVRPPAANFSEGLTKAGLGAPDYKSALEQHQRYCDALARCGLELIRLEADERYPDSCFVEDAALIFNAADEGVRAPSAVITRPGAFSRQGEIESIRAELWHIFSSLKEIQSPGTLDGGDVCEVGKHFFVGISERTNEDGARQLAVILAAHGLTQSLVDIRGIDGLLHLKSGLACLAGHKLIVTEALAQRAELQGYELIYVDPNEEYAANCIEVNGRVLIAAGYPRFEARLQSLGYETMALEMSEFQKMDGGLSCLSLRW